MLLLVLVVAIMTVTAVINSLDGASEGAVDR